MSQNVDNEPLCQEIQAILIDYDRQKVSLLSQRKEERKKHLLEQSRIFQKQLGSIELKKTFLSQKPFQSLNN